MSSTSKLVYAIAFQAGWFVCIMGGDLASVVYVGIFLGFHLWVSIKPKHHFFVYRNALKKEISWVLIIFLFGFALETLSFSGGFLYFEESADSSFFNHLILPPLWLLSLWLIFAIALRTCLSFLLSHGVISFVLSIIFVPLNYYAGANLNMSVNIGQPYIVSFTVITLLWLVFLSSLMKIKHHYFKEAFNAD